jgi:DNA-binding NtrC family response regulator
VLQLLLEASGAERAFLAQWTGGEPRVQAAFSRRSDGRERPSRTVLRRALRHSRPLIFRDLAVERILSGAASIRGLRLRSIVSVPVPAGATRRAALVLDSRTVAALASPLLLEIAESFAALLALAIPAVSPTDPRNRRGKATPALGSSIVGRSRPVRALLQSIRRSAPSNLPILIHGETGSGKETVARVLHEASRRRDGAFVAINCTALSETLLDAELFGSARGAYTGADRDRPGLFRLAQGGTLLLDEVGDTSPAMQAKLLRVIQEKRVRPVGGEREIAVDARILAATHRDLPRMVRAGAFRADLYHRIAVLEVRVPPLRERHRDLRLLVQSLAPRLARETGREPPRLAACAWAALREYGWPGNVRELHSVLARAMLRAGDGQIRAQHLDLPDPAVAPTGSAERCAGSLEAEMIRTSLLAAEGNITQAAGRIGWTRQKLYRRMKALSIDPPLRS